VWASALKMEAVCFSETVVSTYRYHRALQPERSSSLHITYFFVFLFVCLFTDPVFVLLP
jgi:hypothetical protein